MSLHARSVFMAGLLMVSLVTGLVTADPPRPGTEDNGLTENESATLWSRDADTATSAKRSTTSDTVRTALRSIRLRTGRT